MEAYKASSSRWGRCCSGSATRTRAEEIIGCSDEEYGRFDVSEADSARADLQASRKHRISRPNAINVHRPQVMGAPLNGHELLAQRSYRQAWQEIIGSRQTFGETNSRCGIYCNAGCNLGEVLTSVAMRFSSGSTAPSAAGGASGVTSAKYTARYSAKRRLYIAAASGCGRKVRCGRHNMDWPCS